VSLFKNQQVIENLINNNLYDFLRANSAQSLKECCENLRLSDQQQIFLMNLHRSALDQGKEEFLKILEKEHSDSYPLAFDPEPSWNALSTDYLKLLKNKKVVLVGPSNSLIGTGRGSTIEEYDLVVRMNFQWPIPKNLSKDLGERMDILYHCCNADLPINKILISSFNSVKFVCYEKNIDSRPLRRYCKNNNISCMDVTNIYNKLSASLGTAVNTGTVAISHLLQSELAELHITGISFFKEPYYQGYQGDGANPDYWKSGQTPKSIAMHKFAPPNKLLSRINSKRDSRNCRRNFTKNFRHNSYNLGGACLKQKHCLHITIPLIAC
jgi:hypothetical protein